MDGPARRTQICVTLIAVFLLSGSAWADPTGLADLPQIMAGLPGRQFPPSVQRTFLTFETIALEATYYDPSASCTGLNPRLAQMFVFNPEGVLRAQFSVSVTASPLGFKYKLLTIQFAAGLLGPGTYKYTYLLRDCTDNISVVLPEFLSFRVLIP